MGGCSLHYAECLRALLIYQVMAPLFMRSPGRRRPAPVSASSASVQDSQKDDVCICVHIKYRNKRLHACVCVLSVRCC